MKNSSFVVDYVVHGGGYSSEQTKFIFDEKRRLQRWLDVEVALVKAQFSVGQVPIHALEEIVAKADVSNFDISKIAEGVKKTKHSLMPLLNELDKFCAGDAGKYIHKGATTQDIQDTAQSLELKEVLNLVREKACSLISMLAHLAAENKHTIMCGRTHSMTASPITFGLKVASWIDELNRSVQRIDEGINRICVVQLYGGVGTMASLGENSSEIISKFAEILDLQVPDISWHVSRDRIAEFGFILSLVTSTLARIADELRTLNRAEVAEITMSWTPGEIGSSCMPHKRNPEDCEQIVVLGRLVRAQMSLLFEGMILEHERDYRGTRLEWPAIQLMSHYSICSLEIMEGIVNKLKIEKQNMFQNVEKHSQYLCAENLFSKLSNKIGRNDSYALAYNMINEARDKQINLKDYAMKNKALLEVFGEAELRQIFEPQNFLGSSFQQIDEVLKAANTTLSRKKAYKSAA